MTRKRLFMAVVGLAALLTLTITGLIYAGPLGQSQDQDSVPIPDHPERIKEIIEEHEGDYRVLATVNGLDFTVGNLRMGHEHHSVIEPGLTESEAIKAVILERLDDVLLFSVAESRRLTSSEEEARDRMQMTRDICEADAQAEAECRDLMTRMGLDYDAYWRDGVATFQKSQTVEKAMHALRAEHLGNTEAADTQGHDENLDWVVLHKARESAEIVWHDKDIQRLFNEAHAERGEYLDNLE